MPAPQLRVGDDHPVPALAVAAGGRLQRDLQALLHQLERHGPGQVEALADRAGGGEQLVGRERKRRHRSVMFPLRSTTNTADSPDPGGEDEPPGEVLRERRSRPDDVARAVRRPAVGHVPQPVAALAQHARTRASASRSRQCACGLRLTCVGSAYPTHRGPEIACPRPAGSGVATSARPPGTSTRRQVASAAATAASSRCSSTCTATRAPKPRVGQGVGVVVHARAGRGGAGGRHRPRPRPRTPPRCRAPRAGAAGARCRSRSRGRARARSSGARAGRTSAARAGRRPGRCRR